MADTVPEMTVKILEPDGIKEERDHYRYGEVRIVPVEMGTRWCVNGWAEDATGTVPTGPRGKADGTIDLTIQDVPLDTK